MLGAPLPYRGPWALGLPLAARRRRWKCRFAGFFQVACARPSVSIPPRVYGVPGQLFLQHHVSTGGFEPAVTKTPPPIAAVSWMRNGSIAGHLLVCREADGSLHCSMQNENFEDFQRSIASQVKIIQVLAPTITRSNLPAR